jgi:CheY-like chemotaxis protein
MPAHRILIVEDQREVSRLLRSALETLEHELVVAEIPSGEEAILDSSRNKVDLLVADYRLPGMTGVELQRKVRKNNPQTKIILITGQTDPRIRKEIAEAGANAYFIKPVPIADFLDAVERHLGLVETILPPEPIAVDDKEIQRSLPDLLAALRQELSAKAVLLFNDTGRVLARAGGLPNKIDETALISSLLAIHSSGQKVGRQIGQSMLSNWHVFDGGQYELIFAPVGISHAMLVMGERLAGEDQVLKTVEIFSRARKDIERVLGGSKLGPDEGQPPQEPQVEDKEQVEKDLDPLFKGSKKKLKASDVDKFWDDAADKHTTPSKPDMLSYDQAKQLGLTPKDES